MKSRMTWVVAAAAGLCLTTGISKDSKQKSSENLAREAGAAQFSVLSSVWI